MNYIVFVVTIIVFGCISQGNALKCFVCFGEECNSKNIKLETCTDALAYETKGLLRLYHTGGNYGSPTGVFECFQEDLRNGIKGTIYKGCIFANVKGCELPVAPKYVTSKRACNQCNKDGCNPGDRVTIV